MRSFPAAALALAVCSVLALTACGSPGSADAGRRDSGHGGSGGVGGGAGGSTGGGGGQAGGSGGGTAFDAGPGWGQSCTTDSECTSNLCRSDFPGLPTVCVIPCTRAQDCAALPDFFCEPLDAGSAQGWCLPHSPAHCLECATNADCGSLSAVCTSTAMDPLPACHVDCSLGGDVACPADYSCVPQTVDGGLSRMLCVPTTGLCQDALGGFCDRLTTSPSCHVTTDAGSCGGQRYCIGGGRFDLCSAPAPQCKATCASLDHANCTETFCDSAVNTVQNCGSCGHACPGVGVANAVAGCTALACTLACQGENYDVDGQASNGCEVADVPTGNHLTGTASTLTSIDCYDTSTLTGTGTLPADGRAHLNFDAAQGFDAVSGSAPDVFSIAAQGGTFCANDVVVTLTMSGATNPACYQLTAVTDKHTYSCATNSGGTCGINHTTSQYSGGTNILFTIAKTCSSVTRGAPTYTLTGHL